MLKIPSLSSLSHSLAAGLLLLTVATAQRGPLPGIPLVPPPVPHPALASQPLISEFPSLLAAASNAKVKVRQAKKQPRPDPSTHGIKKKGRDLKKAVARVKAMPWVRSLDVAASDARRLGKPILVLQTLGKLTGYA